MTVAVLPRPTSSPISTGASDAHCRRSQLTASSWWGYSLPPRTHSGCSVISGVLAAAACKRFVDAAECGDAE